MPTDAGSRDGRIRITYRTPTFLHSSDAQLLRNDSVAIPQAGSVKTMTILAAQTPSGTLADPSYAYLRSLPTDPNVLFPLLRGYAQAHGVTPAQQMLDTVATLLSWSVAPPELRAALYEVATRIPGIEAVGTTADASGRRGTALAVTVAGRRYELIFDPSTSRLLGTREVVLNDPTHRIPSGTVLDDTAITISAVDAIGQS